MSGPPEVIRLRSAAELTQPAVRGALTQVVTDLCAAVDPNGVAVGNLEFPRGRLESAILATHRGVVPWRHPFQDHYQWHDSERRSFAEMARHLGSQVGGDMAWQAMLFVGLAFSENEVANMSADVFRGELLVWLPGMIEDGLPVDWLFHPAIAAVARNRFMFPAFSKFRVFVEWYERHYPLVKREPFTTGPLLPPRFGVPRPINRAHPPSLPAPPSVPAPAPAPASPAPRLKSEEVEVKKEEEDEW
ncbi:hypothetical protein V8F20_004782 [Naviculisporaceae sp. PSN 640]